MATDDEDVGVLPSHLQPLLSLMRPSTGEIAAAQATGPSGNPALLGAYWLQRMGGLQEARQIAEQSQRDNLSIARQKLGNARQKSLLDFFKGEPVVSRLENPNSVFAAATGLPIQSPGMDDLHRQLLKSRIFANMQKGQGSNGQQDTTQEVYDNAGRLVSTTKTQKTKGGQPAKPSAPKAATPAASSEGYRDTGETGINPKTGKQAKIVIGPDGKKYYDNQ